ncbi:16S rRNA (guanine(966)-N(2))-methyltransferase RsmD [Eionea flava]
MPKNTRKKTTKKPTAATQKTREGDQQLRIIGGQWRGRKLSIANVDGLRPTGDRIRETLFNWLTGYVANSHCLDLFAGSGALGFECLSRGAAQVTLLEKHPQAAAQLRQHQQQLSSEQNSDVIETDTLTWLNDKHHPSTPVDIVFLDPPFAGDLWDQAIKQLEENIALSNRAIIYIETPKNKVVAIPSHWLVLKEKTSGQVCYRLFQRNTPP